ncbi:MAG TPA: Ig-like domain-containing protein [Gemmatimonadaceae bacterium]|nr:Ig-like domain-containing protein [Gemmatimonadaceae bacterium]
MVACAAAISAAACRDGWITDPIDSQAAGAVIVSNPVPAAAAAAAAGALGGTFSVGALPSTVAYVSLPPGTATAAAVAGVVNPRLGLAASTAVVDGGFDPIAIAAAEGDTLELTLRDPEGRTLMEYRAPVERSRPPVVVRTSPPPRKRDVPLYTVAAVVFSEPIDSATINGASMLLRRGGEPVPGTLLVGERDGTSVAFLPDDALQPNTSYELVITTAVRDLDGDALPAPVVVEFTTASATPQSPDGPSILIDASRDGGAWWYPQWAQEGGFDPELDHQGKALAEYFRSRGFAVVELPRPYTITAELLAGHDFVIRASGFGGYLAGEIAAYREYVEAGGQLLLLGDHMMHLPADELAESLGVRFAAITRGENVIDRYTAHPLTEGLDTLYYGVGSGVVAHPASAQILGWLSEDSYLDLNKNSVFDEGEPTSPPVFGVMPLGAGRIVFFGDVNTFNWVPQPLVDNLLAFLASP